MQLPWDEHFHEIVVPAWQTYLDSERQLTKAIASGDEGLVQKARYNALREGGAASFYLHHFGEVVLRARPHWLPEKIRSSHRIVEWLSGYCTMLRSEFPVSDVTLLRDIADALKHAILTQRLNMRQVFANEAVLAVASAYGELNFGEGKYSGEQVVIQTTDGKKRALSSVLQNVIDAWRRVANLPLPEIGKV